MSITIRPLKAEDYPATTDIYNSQNEPHHQASNEALRMADTRARQSGHYHLLSALKDGEVIGRGQVGTRVDDSEPGKYWTWFFTHEDHLGAGVDSALFDAALDLLSDRSPTSLWTCIREDFVPAAEFLRERDYEEQFRSWGANVELATFLREQFSRYGEALTAQGIALIPYHELNSDPHRDSKIATLPTRLRGHRTMDSRK